MKKVVSSFLAVAGLMAAPSVLPNFASAHAQAAAANGQVTMDPPEAAAYDNAVNKQTTPQTQAPAIEAYLQQYPKSAVKPYMLSLLLNDYSQFDPAKAITAADNVLQLNPNDIQALYVETVFRSQMAAAQTDPAAKQSGMDAAAGFAQKGLNATKPDAITQDAWDTNKKKVTPIFYSTIGNDALAKKDYPAAIAAFKSEIAAADPAATQAPGTTLQDIYYLGQAYYSSTPPDYVNCTFYTTRAAVYAGSFASQLQPLADYCYKKYHGTKDGYDAVVAAAKANLNPPDGFTITPAPSDADVAHKFVMDNASSLETLAISDKEFILANGSTEDADKVFNTVKGKTDKIPNATVVSATPDQVQVAFSDDAIQSKTADITFNMKTPLKTVPPVGTKITLIGTWASYTQKPLMITMSDAEEVTKAPAAKTPARRR